MIINKKKIEGGGLQFSKLTTLVAGNKAMRRSF